MESICSKPQNGLGKSGLTAKTLKSLHLLAQASKEGAPPPDIDHRKHVNPYLSNYGEKWEDKIKKSKKVKNVINDFLFYHGALSLMTNKELLEWMREKSILKHWILPEGGLNSGTPYAGCPTGNNPDFNTLDCHASRHIHCAVEEHCTYTAYLKKEDPIKFSMCTSKQLESAYRRLWDPILQKEHSLCLEAGVPSLSLILADSDTIVNHVIMSHYYTRGCVIPGSSNRAGKQKEEDIPSAKR
eukprot:1442783-Ditylum_brightwellii.AAC.1